MGILSGNPTKEPMHYGEVFGIWSYITTAKGLIAGYQTKLNHTGDEDLAKLLEEAIQQAQQEVKQIEVILKDNGIGLPPTPPERPKANLEDIPVGARFQDAETAATLGASISAGLVSCSMQMGQSNTRRYCHDVWTISYSKSCTWRKSSTSYQRKRLVNTTTTSSP